MFHTAIYTGRHKAAVNAEQTGSSACGMESNMVKRYITQGNLLMEVNRADGAAG